MLITVQTTSKKLNDLLSASDLANISANYEGDYQVEIQNLGSQDIYIEMDQAATTTKGRKIVQNATFAFNLTALGRVNLIANSSNNTNVRITIL